MAKVQFKYIKRRYAEGGQTGTATYDLPNSGFIPEIILGIASTPTASSACALPLNDAITKVEIVDGAEVIKSLTGNQIRALQMIHDRKELALTEWDMDAAESTGFFKLIFAKMINGIHYCPDFAKFSNPQIKVSWDYSLTERKGVTYDADVAPAIKVTVLCKIVREGGHGYTHGYIKSSNIKTLTQAVSTTHVIEVPRGRPLVGLMVDAGYDGLDWTEDVESLRLDFDNGAWVPVELYEAEIPIIMDQWFNGPFQLTYVKAAFDDLDLDSHMGYITTMQIEPSFDDSLSPRWEAVNRGIETFGVDSTETPTAFETMAKYYFKVAGYLPFQCLYVPMSALNNGVGDIVDTTRFGRIELELTSGALADTASRPDVIAEYLII